MMISDNCKLICSIVVGIVGMTTSYCCKKKLADGVFSTIDWDKMAARKIERMNSERNI